MIELDKLTCSQVWTVVSKVHRPWNNKLAWRDRAEESVCLATTDTLHVVNKWWQRIQLLMSCNFLQLCVEQPPTAVSSLITQGGKKNLGSDKSRHSLAFCFELLCLRMHDILKTTHRQNIYGSVICKNKFSIHMFDFLYYHSIQTHNLVHWFLSRRVAELLWRVV